MKSSTRINEIDVAKGIGIFLIVFGHAIINGYPKTVVFSFHVPLFFVLSGMVFSYKPNWKQFIKKKTIRLYVPYLIVSFLSLLIFELAILFIGDRIPEFEVGAGPLQCALGIFYGSSKVLGLMKWNQPLWFIPCMFLVLVVAYFIEFIFSKVANKKAVVYIRVILMLACLTASYVFTFIDVALPFSGECAIYMLFYFEIGIVISASYVKIRENLKRRVPLLVIIFVISMSLVCIASIYNGFGQVRTMILGNSFLLYSVIAIIGSFGIIAISVVLRNLKFLQYLGHASLFIMLFHKFPILFFQNICPVTKDLLKAGDTLAGNTCAILVSIISILMVLVLYWIVNKTRTVLSKK